jgi:hypothetical protein
VSESWLFVRGYLSEFARENTACYWLWSLPVRLVDIISSRYHEILPDVYKTASCLLQYSELHCYQKSVNLLCQWFVTRNYWNLFTWNDTTNLFSQSMIWCLCFWCLHDLMLTLSGIVAPCFLKDIMSWHDSFARDITAIFWISSWGNSTFPRTWMFYPSVVHYGSVHA